MISNCLNCEKEIKYSPSNRRGKYCNNKCQGLYQRKQMLKNGTMKSGSMRSFLIEKYGYNCSMCGWNKINPSTNKCPIELDHIDGNSNNNTEKNCRLLCPNCHSLTPTYKALNKGKGRKANIERYYRERKAYLDISTG